MKPVSHGPLGRWRIGSGWVRSLRNVAVRVGSGEEIVKSHGSGRVSSFSNLAGRVGSGRVKKLSELRGSGRVKPTHLETFVGRVGSDR